MVRHLDDDWVKDARLAFVTIGLGPYACSCYR